MAKLTVDVNSSTLAAEHSVGNVGSSVRVSISNSEDTSLVSAHGTSDLDLIRGHLEIHLVWESRGLSSRDVNEECIALDGVALGEVDIELVELHVLGLVLVLATILKTFERSDYAVVDGDVPGRELLVPVCRLGFSTSLTLGCAGAIGECNNITVQCVDFQDGTKHTGDVSDNAEGLITVF